MGISDDMKRITENIRASHDLRVKALGQIVTDVHSTLDSAQDLVKGFAGDRKIAAAAQAKDLTGFVTDLAKGVGGMLGGFQKEHKEMSDDLRKSLQKSTRDIQTYVKNRLKDFSDTHADMTAAMRKDLTKFTKDTADYVKGALADARKTLGDIAEERSKMAAAWRGGAAEMARKRAVSPVGVGAKAAIKTVEEAIAKPKARKKAAPKGRKKSRK